MEGTAIHRERRLLAATLAGLVVAMALVVGAARPAGAQSYGPQPVGVTCTVSVGLNGFSLVCTATGFRPGATVTFTIFSAPMSLGTAVADANRNATISASLPSTFPTGDHRVEASGDGLTGSAAAVSTVVFLPANAADATSGTDTSRSLPRTGLDVAALASAGSALVAFGGLIVFTARRRRRRSTALAGG